MKPAQPDRAFDVFISYATDPDYQTARSLQRFLKTFHRLPLIKHRKLPELSVCLDSGSFVARREGRRQSVEEMVDDHLRRSRLLLVLCSSGAARSSYVNHEVEWFLEHRGADAIHLAVTEGKDPVADPTGVFPPAVLAAGLETGVWYDLRGLRWWRARRWNKVRDAGRERIRLVADLLVATGKTPELTADDLYPDWQQHQRSQAHKTSVRWGVAAAALLVMALAAGAAFQRSRVQGELAALRDRAAETRRIVAHEPEQALAEAAAVWGGVQAAADGRWPFAPEAELGQARFEAQSALFEVLSSRPGWVGTLTGSMDDALVQSSQDATRLAVAGTSNGEATVEVWVAGAGGIRNPLRAPWPERIQCVAVAADGRTLAVAGRRWIGTWSLDSEGGPVASRTMDLATGDFSQLSCSSAAIRPGSGDVVLGSNDGLLFRLDARSWALSRIEADSFDGIVNDLEFDREGKKLYVAVWRRSPAIFVLDLEGKTRVTSLDGEDGDDAPRSLALDRDGARIFSGHERGTVVARSTVTGEILWRDRLGPASIVDLCTVSDGVVAGDESGHVVWFAPSGSRRRSLPVRMARTLVTALAAFPPGGFVATAGAGDPVRIWRSDSAHPLEQLAQRDSGGGGGISLSRDGARLTAFGETEVFAWTRQGTQWLLAESPLRLELPAGWRIARASPDGSLFAVSAAYADESPDPRIRLVTRTGEIQVLPGFEAKLGQMAFSPTGRWLAVATFDQPLRVALWETDRPGDEPRILETPKGVGGTAVVFSADESLLGATDLKSCIYVWRLAQAESSPVSHCDESEMPDEIDFAPSGALLAVGSLTGRIRIFAVEQTRLTERTRLDGHSESTTALAFDASGKWLISASNSGDLRFWDTATWQPVGVVLDPDDSFVRQIVAGPVEGSIATLTQGGRRVSSWSFTSEEMLARAEELASCLGGADR